MIMSKNDKSLDGFGSRVNIHQSNEIFYIPELFKMKYLQIVAPVRMIEFKKAQLVFWRHFSTNWTHHCIAAGTGTRTSTPTPWPWRTLGSRGPAPTPRSSCPRGPAPRHPAPPGTPGTPATSSRQGWAASSRPPPTSKHQNLLLFWPYLACFLSKYKYVP